MKIPIVLWSDETPSHRITCICVCKSGVIVTGSIEGQLVFWFQKQEDENIKIIPKSMIVAHSSCVESLVAVQNQKLDINSAVISLAANQEICLWNSETCCCLTSAFLQGRFHTLYVLPCRCRKSLRESLLACFGYQNLIYILDPFTLQPVYLLQPELLKCRISTIRSVTCTFDSNKQGGEQLLAVTHDGSLITWSLPCTTTASKEAKPIKIYGKVNNLIKNIGDINIRYIYAEPEFSRCILLCSQSYFHLYSLPTFDPLFTQSTDELIIRGAIFVSPSSFILYFADSMPIYYVFGKKTAKILTNHLTAHPHNINLECACFFTQHNKSMLQYLFGASFSGFVFAWNLNVPSTTEFAYVTSLNEVWEAACPRGIAKNLAEPFSDSSGGVSCSLQLQEYGFMIFGLKNGSIVIASTIELLVNQTFGVGTLEQVASLVLRGHTGAVTCLCHPFEEWDKHNPCHLLSGSVDFTVRLWNLVTGAQLKIYVPHGGFIHYIFVLPGDSSSTDLKVVTVASDYSVALINLALEKEVLTAHAHTSPVYSVRLLAKEDLLLVYCTDGTLFIWQVTTGNLERCITGTLAIDIFQACDNEPEPLIGQPRLIVNLDQQERPKFTHRSFLQDIKTKRSFVSSHTHNAHVLSSKKKVLQKFFRRKQYKIRNNRDFKSKDQKGTETHHLGHGVSGSGLVSHHSSACNLASYSLAQHSEEDGAAIHTSCPLLPFGVIPIRTGHHDPDFHVVLVDIEFLVSHLVCEDQKDICKRLIPSTSPSSPTASGNFISSFNLSANKFPLGFTDTKESLSLMTLTLGLSPTSDGRSYKKYCQYVQNYRSYVLLNTARLLVACLRPWGLDAELDRVSRLVLTLTAPAQSVTYGFMCRHKLQLTMPGWSQERPVKLLAMGQWQVSSVISAQHLVALLALTDALMYLYKPATPHPDFSRIVAVDGRQFIATSVPDLSRRPQSFEPLKTLSKMHEQHSTLTAIFMKQKSPYQAPAIHELICYWLDACTQIRDASYQLLVRQLKQLSLSFRQSLVRSWSLYLPTPEEVDTVPIAELLALPAEDYLESGGFFGFWPSDRRHLRTLSVFLVSFVITEFPTEFDPINFSKKDVSDSVISVSTLIVLAAILFKTLRSNLDLKTTNQYLIRKAFLSFLSINFPLWQPHLNLSQLLTSFLEATATLDLHLIHLATTSRQSVTETPYAQLLYSYRHCLKDIVISRPEVVITVLNKDLGRSSIGGTHMGLGQSALVAAVAYTSMRHNPLSSHPTILQLARNEVVSLVETMATKTPHVFIQLSLETIDLLLNCSAHKLFKKDQNLLTVFPFLKGFGILDYCNVTRRFVVGTIRGQFGLYDVRNLRCILVTSFTHPITCLKFGPDGRQLVAYSHQEMKLCIWNTHASIFGFLGNTPKPGVNFHLKQPRVLTVEQAYQTHIHWNNSSSFKIVFYDERELSFTM